MAGQSHCCLKNPPVLSSTCGSGSVNELGGLKAYISGPIDSNRAILLLSDVFGYEAPNLRKLADKISAEGFLVVVPDFLYGDPANYEDPAFDFQAWKKIHSPEKACEDAKLVIDALRSRGITSLGVGGVCFGGSAAVKLAKLDAIKAAVALHPSDQLSLDEINDVTVPTAFLGAQNDLVSPPDQLKQFGDILSAKPGGMGAFILTPSDPACAGLYWGDDDDIGCLLARDINSMVKIFPGVSHGFGLRYDVEDESAVKRAEEAHSYMINWLAIHV